MILMIVLAKDAGGKKNNECSQWRRTLIACLLHTPKSHGGIGQARAGSLATPRTGRMRNASLGFGGARICLRSSPHDPAADGHPVRRRHLRRHRRPHLPLGLGRRRHLVPGPGPGLPPAVAAPCRPGSTRGRGAAPDRPLSTSQRLAADPAAEWPAAPLPRHAAPWNAARTAPPWSAARTATGTP